MQFENFFQNLEIYTTVVTVIDHFIDVLFDATGSLSTNLTAAVTATAGVYIALMGYAVMSGTIAMTQREAALKLGKVILIIFLLQTFSTITGATFDAVWEVPEAVGSFITNAIFDGLGSVFGGALAVLGAFSVVTDFDGLVNFHAGVASLLADSVQGTKDANSQYPVYVWAFAMAPAVLVTVSILLAKMISAVLFVVAPVVFMLSLLGFKQNFLMSWIKALISTFVTVIIVYAVGTVGLIVTLIQMANAFVPDLSTIITGSVEKYSIPELAPLGITSIFSVILLTQAPAIASALIGVAAVSTQQATSFMQTGALQAAIGRSRVDT